MKKADIPRSASRHSGVSMSALPKKVLLATDGSEDANLAARAATDIAKGFGSDLHLVHALETYPRYAYPGVTSEVYSYVLEKEDGEARGLLDEQAKRVRDGGGEVAEAHLRRGPVVDEVLELAEEVGAGLVVLGSRGLGPVERLALGSVSEGVVHHATRPVLVIRGLAHEVETDRDLTRRPAGHRRRTRAFRRQANGVPAGGFRQQLDLLDADRADDGRGTVSHAPRAPGWAS
jgi:nucleotide-binding universal stress UspA family protein